MDVRHSVTSGAQEQQEGGKVSEEGEEEVADSMLKFIDAFGDELPVFPTSAKYRVGTGDVVEFLAGAVKESLERTVWREAGAGIHSDQQS